MRKLRYEKLDKIPELTMEAEIPRLSIKFGCPYHTAPHHTETACMRRAFEMAHKNIKQLLFACYSLAHHMTLQINIHTKPTKALRH